VRRVETRQERLVREYIYAKRRAGYARIPSIPLGFAAGYTSGVLFNAREGGAFSTLLAASTGGATRILFNRLIRHQLGDKKAKKIFKSLFPDYKEQNVEVVLEEAFEVSPATSQKLSAAWEDLTKWKGEGSEIGLTLYKYDHPEMRKSVDRILAFREQQANSVETRINLFSEAILAGAASTHAYFRNDRSLLWATMWGLGSFVFGSSVMMGVALAQGTDGEGS